MIFQNASSKSGPYELGHEQGWHWSTRKGGHASGQDFFWVHWEISSDRPNDVKLHVESPKASVDEELNNLKQEVIKQLLTVQFQKLIENSDWEFARGIRLKTESIENNKSTQVFRVVLPPEQKKETHQQNIEMVNSVAREAINEVLAPFKDRLDKRFS